MAVVEYGSEEIWGSDVSGSVTSCILLPHVLPTSFLPVMKEVKEHVRLFSTASYPYR